MKILHLELQMANETSRGWDQSSINGGLFKLAPSLMEILASSEFANFDADNAFRSKSGLAYTFRLIRRSTAPGTERT